MKRMNQSALYQNQRVSKRIYLVWLNRPLCSLKWRRKNGFSCIGLKCGTRRNQAFQKGATRLVRQTFHYGEERLTLMLFGWVKLCSNKPVVIQYFQYYERFLATFPTVKDLAEALWRSIIEMLGRKRLLPRSQYAKKAADLRRWKSSVVYFNTYEGILLIKRNRTILQEQSRVSLLIARACRVDGNLMRD